jgi:putative transport protein
MEWMTELFTHPEAAQSIIILCLVAALGLALGRLQFKGVAVGIAGVLFVGLLAGHFGLKLDPGVSSFAKELGLILFVYTIGIQLGPSFFGSLKSQGLKLNTLAASVVLLGVLMTLLIAWIANLPLALATGLFTGAVTNTPALGAAQQALQLVPGIDTESLTQPGLGYAIAYPGGVIGIISTLVLLRIIWRISLPDEVSRYRETDAPKSPALERWNLRVKNPNLKGLRVDQIPGMDSLGVTVSRVLHQDTLQVATNEAVLDVGDVLLVVGPESELEKLRVVVGSRSSVDLFTLPGTVESTRIVVTQTEIVGQTLKQLSLPARYGVNVTRLLRGDLELVPRANLALQMGDLLTVVGTSQDIKIVSTLLGNSTKALQHLEIAPVFVGIALGILVGSIPFHFPALPAAVKLGLAGGPLIVGMLLSRIGKIGPLVWYMPPNANALLREAGIILFLACVGLKSGTDFFHALSTAQGWLWMLCAAAITVVPLLIVGFVGRLWMKCNFLTLTGVLAGSMTDPPALAYANSLSDSNGASVAYATVYPLTMILRVIAAQLLILIGLS